MRALPLSLFEQPAIKVLSNLPASIIDRCMETRDSMQSNGESKLR
jgi:hypothetical protein